MMKLNVNVIIEMLIIVFGVAFGENNITESSVISALDEQDEFDCNPTDLWEKLQYDSKEIKGVCIMKDYQKTEPPMKTGLTLLYVLDHVTKISSINEKSKSLELDIKMRYLWEDTRIKAQFSDYMDFHRLPPIKKDESFLTWVPVTEIQDLKSLNFLNDPIKFNWVLLYMASSHDPTFPPKATLIHAMIDWHVVVSCDFDFTNYPLDDQRCGIHIWLYDSNVTYVDQPFGVKSSLSENATTTHGYEVVKKIRPTSQETIQGTLIGFGNFGYDIEMKRIKRPYFYQYYLPCASIVVASHLSFIVPISATPGRIALVVTQFLTLTNLFINQKVNIQSFQ